MSVGAILIVGASPHAGDGAEVVSIRRSENEVGLDGGPLACLDVLGQCSLERTAQYLNSQGVSPLGLVSDWRVSDLARIMPASLINHHVIAPRGEMGTAVERLAADYAESGVETIVVIRFGAYIEFDLGELLRHHRERGHSVSRVQAADGPLDLWIADTKGPGFRTIAAEAFGHSYPGLHRGRAAGALAWDGYVNRLAHPSDLRRLAIDAFLSRCAIRPRGTESKPGVWIDQGARLEGQVRLVAPAYIGRNTVVRAGSLITRFSSIERDCHVESNTVVEDASILPGTFVGNDLDITHSVLQGGRLVHLVHQVSVNVSDPTIIAAIPSVSARKPWFGRRRAPAPLPQFPLEQERPYVPAEIAWAPSEADLRAG
jgi:hypothetical protein